MARNLQAPMIKTIVASAAVTATGNSAKFTLPIADTYTFVINATTVTGTSPTLDIVYQSSPDGGTTFINLPWRHTQVTAAAVLYLTVRLGLGVGEVGIENAAAATGGTLSKPAVPFDLTNMRLGYTVAGTSPSFTFAVFLAALPPGALPFA